MKYTAEICRVSILKSLTLAKVAAFLLFFLTQQAFAQVVDDFSDGDFTAHPTWVGTESKFTISANALKLQAPAVADQAYLSTESTAINDAVWECFVKLEFNPSSSNYMRLYLVADSANLSGSLNGYFVMIGNTADEVSLYRQSGNTITKIIDGVDGRVDLSTVSAKIKVTRSASGSWQLFSDVGLSGTYTEEGTVTDATHLSSFYFGVFCKYTSTRSDKFFVDDVFVTGNPMEDVVPPEVNFLHVVSSTVLDVVFTEKVDPASAEIESNYDVSNAINNPTTAILQSDGKTVQLSFTQSFPNGITSTLTVSRISDLADNELISVTKPFIYFLSVPALYKDIIITEIFADPSPIIDLPAAEYVELFNRSENPVELLDWIFTDGNSSAILPAKIILPNTYLILTSTQTATLFSSYGDVLGVSNFPTLNNDGDALVLKDGNDLAIDSVNYTSDWYKSDDKKEGGWSLELIDPNNVCSEGENWIASEDNSGGTPGKQNSVLADKPDVTGPKLISAIPISSNTLRLRFNEKLEKEIPSTQNFSIDPTATITAVSFANSSLTQLDLHLDAPLQSRLLYKVTVQHVRDCNGNEIQSRFNTITFGLPETPDSVDVVINEILFNPRPTGIDFVEIVNTSPRFLNIKNWTVGNYEDNTLTHKKPIASTDFLLAPGSYLVLTENANILKGEYMSGHEENFLETPSMPSLNDDEGSVAIADSAGNILDQLQYYKAWHSVFIKDEEGVSLERIAMQPPTQESQNWKSASSLVGFATPGYVNSNAMASQNGNPETITVNPEAFIPSIGQPDFTQIHFTFGQGGYVANVKIFDSEGHIIKQLANNEVLGTEGFLRWDGDRDDGTKARMGYYMVWFQVFNSNGEVKEFRKRVAIAGD